MIAQRDQGLHEPPSFDGQRSIGGFLPLPESGRQVWDFGIGWRFRRGSAPGVEDERLDDTAWELVNLPHGVDGVLPEEASGCANYQGPAHYRKVFTPPESVAGRRVVVVFEGILGRSRIWLNGVLLHEHFSGFLPAVIDLTPALRVGERNTIVVTADNSDDPSSPPGKPQAQLDYSYFGGIYRDVALIATSPVHITDPNEVDIVAGGGVFAYTRSLSEERAEVCVDVHVANTSSSDQVVVMEVELRAPNGETVGRSRDLVEVSGRGQADSRHRLRVESPEAWSPSSPALHDLHVRLLSSEGDPHDGVRLRFGIRTVELDAARGLVLNGSPVSQKLIGANRHQDHALLGFALPDSMHWRDARMLRDAGIVVVRNAHYPQSRAFMDACDALGVFVIVNTPGWQFWNDDDPVFEERVYRDIRNMVRRDRNHACVLLWEPILNETSYPSEFAANAHAITHAEYPFPGCFTAADEHAAGHEVFDVLFGHPAVDDDERHRRAAGGRIWFTREWGDNVDDWSSQNSPSRVARGWGEGPQLVQAIHYAMPSYPYTSIDSLRRTPAAHIGGTLWHAFDHQRGYHPDPFFGGIADAFRLPKYSYEVFRAHRPVEGGGGAPVRGATVFIAHEMTPFSPADVTVFSNCEEVRLSFNGTAVGSLPVPRTPDGLPSPVVVFPRVFDFMAMKHLARAGRGAECALTAQGLVGGEVVATQTIRPAGRPDAVRLRIEGHGTRPTADGTDIVTIVASVTDDAGNVRRLNNGEIAFRVFGAGELVGDVADGGNRRMVRWGEAAALVRMSQSAGAVRVVAEYVPRGAQMPVAGVLEFESVPSVLGQLFDESPRIGSPLSRSHAVLEQVDHDAEDRRRHRERNREVERQQADFE